MARRGHCILFLIAAFAAGPLFAQQSQDDRIKELERRLDQLMQQSNALKDEITALKNGQPATQPQPTADQDLTKVGVVAAPTPLSSTAQQQARPANEQPQTAMTDVQTVNNVSNPGAAKALNPDISVNGNFFGKAGPKNPYEFGSNNDRNPLRLDEAEVAFQAFIDPYAKANFFLSASPEGLTIEEGYAQFVTLPYGLTARAGKFKALFGKANTWHTHVRPWVDQPLVIHNFFTDDQFSDSGVEVSKMFENPFAFVEGTAEVFAGNVDRVFQRRNQSDLVYNGHLKVFKDISENSNIEVGASYARGGAANADAANQFAGVDVTYRWKPLQRATRQSLIGRFEGIVNKSPMAFTRNPRGFYASLDYQFAQRWFTGVRVDSADDIGLYRDVSSAPGLLTPLRDRGASATLTFWPSEFSQLRGQLRRTSYGGARSVTEFLFQLQFAIGAHGAHTF